MLSKNPKNILLLTTVLFTVVFSLLHSQPVRAHSADTYYQSCSIYLTPQEAMVEWYIYPGTLYAQAVWDEADRDGNGEVSSAEAETWAGELLKEIQISLEPSTKLEWQLESTAWPESFVEFGLEHQPIRLNLQAAWPTDTAGTQRLEIDNQYIQEATIHWFSVEGADGVYFQTPEQQNGLVRFEFFIPTASDSGEDQPPQTEEKNLFYWDSGTPQMNARTSLQDDSEGVGGSSQASTSPTEILTDLISLPELSTVNYLLILGTTLLLGGIHALTPGHGKALVAAYLVGIRGTLRHASALGGIITMTHTGSVLAIGAITLVASQYLLPSILIPGLETVSSLVIIIMGMYMIRRGWQGYRAVRRSQDATSTSREDNPGTQRITVGEDIETRVYDDLLPEDNLSITNVNWRSLLTLGVSGGLVPCPDAIAILFVAAAINRVPLGIALILAFSVGMAIVLITLGFAFVRGRGLLENFKPFRNLSSIIPMISGFIVLGMGVAVSLGALNSTALQSISPLTGAPEAQTLEREPGTEITDKPFNIGSASILYLEPDRKGRSQLYQVRLSDGETKQLTNETSGVTEYALAPDGGTAAYFVHDNKAKCEIWGLVIASDTPLLLTTYENSECSGLAWSPDGSRIVYQVLDLSDEGTTGLASLWWLDPYAGEKETIFQGGQYQSYNAVWSPSGEWLSYTSLGITTTLEIYNLEDGSRISTPTQTITSPLWNPDGKSVLIIDLVGDGDDKSMHLLQLDIETGEVTDLSQGEETYDRYAAWAPDGDAIAVVRLVREDNNSLSGDHIWIIESDYWEDRRLTSHPDCLHRQLVWSPDGVYLLFERIFLDEDSKQSSLWMMEVRTGRLILVAKSGSQAAWMP